METLRKAENNWITSEPAHVYMCTHTHIRDFIAWIRCHYNSGFVGGILRTETVLLISFPGRKILLSICREVELHTGEDLLKFWPWQCPALATFKTIPSIRMIGSLLFARIQREIADLLFQGTLYVLPAWPMWEGKLLSESRNKTHRSVLAVMD